MQRIMIIGGPGSGKSTLARQMGKLLGLPVVHIDPMYWSPGWVQRDNAETQRLIAAAAQSEAWVFEGNHSASHNVRADRADLIIYLDPPRVRRFWRVLKRSILHYGVTRPDMSPGCPERFDLAFLAFVWRWDRTGRPRSLALLGRMQARTQTRHLTRPAAVRRFLAGVATM